MAFARTPYSLARKRVWVTGHRGMVGSALVRRLKQEDCQILTASRSELDLRQQSAVKEWVARNAPQVIFAIAAKVGGIGANRSFPAEFVYDNLQIQNNVIHSAYEGGAEKLLFVGSNCNYPKHSPQPIPESALLQGPLDDSIQWYAIAKIAGLLMCKSYRRQYGFDCISVMPPNLLGPGDNYDPASSHVSAAIIHRVYEAKLAGAPSLDIWGSGQQRREFLFVDDLADAMVFLMKHYSDEEIINIGSGTDMSIAEFAQTVVDVIGYNGKLCFDRSKPEGTPRKLLDSSRLKALGWQARTDICTAVLCSYQDLVARTATQIGRAA
jgi:GDP-L-fucose synthase